MKATVFVGWEDAPHLPTEVKKAMLAAIPPWQRQSRSQGIPQLGAGAIYQVPESEFVVTGYEIPRHYRRVFGFDVGWNRTAVLWGAVNPDTGGIVIYDEYYRGQAEPSVHAAAIKSRGDWIPGVIDPASRGRSQIDGRKLFDMYQELGLNISKADNAREAGIQQVWELLSQGQLKVLKSCTNFLSEYRLYRRDERGQVVKKNDHLMDALRYLVMSGIERAEIQPTGQPNGLPWFHWQSPAVWAG